MKGPPPKPAERKRLTGNPGKRALPEPLTLLPGVQGPPDPLRPLAAPGRSLWDRVWAAGSTWVSPNTDVELLQLVCEATDERASLRLRVLRDGDWRDRIALRAIEAQLLTGLGLLGLTPADRSRLGVGEVRSADELDVFKARQAARRALIGAEQLDGDV